MNSERYLGPHQASTILKLYYENSGKFLAKIIIIIISAKMLHHRCLEGPEYASEIYISKKFRKFCISIWAHRFCFVLVPLDSCDFLYIYFIFLFSFFVGSTECRLGTAIFCIFLHMIFKRQHFLRFFGSYFPAQHKSPFFP